jgi:hypothetical protein
MILVLIWGVFRTVAALSGIRKPEHSSGIDK